MLANLHASDSRSEVHSRPTGRSSWGKSDCPKSTMRRERGSYTSGMGPFRHARRVHSDLVLQDIRSPQPCTLSVYKMRLFVADHACRDRKMSFFIRCSQRRLDRTQKVHRRASVSSRLAISPSSSSTSKSTIMKLVKGPGSS